MELVWSGFAIQSLKEVFDYYAKNVSRSVAHKIRTEILLATAKPRMYPKLGQIEPTLVDKNQNHRYFLVGNYKVIYRITENVI